MIHSCLVLSRIGGMISTTKLIMGKGLGLLIPLSCSSKNNNRKPECTGLYVAHTIRSALKEHKNKHIPLWDINHVSGFVFQSSVHNMVEAGDSTVNKQGLNPVAKEVCDEEGVTCFVEAGTVVSTKPSAGTMSVHRPSSDVLISEFLARPVLLDTFAWSSASTNGSTLSTQVPSSYIVTGDWAEKLRGFQLFRGTFVIRIELNPSPFMAGALVGSWMPQNKNTISQPATLVGAYQLPHVFITARDTTAEFRIPFVSPYQYHDKGKAAGERDCWGTFRLLVASQLSVGASSPYSTLDVAVYGHWEDVEITSPILPQSNMTFESFRKDKPISKGLKKVSKLAGAFKDVPVIGTMASSVEWAASLAGGVASALGFSKPIVQEPPGYVANRNNPYAHISEGPVVNYSLASIANPSVSSDNQCTYTDEDEMSLEYLYQIPNYVSSIAWSGANATGTVLLNRAITPRTLYGASGSVPAPGAQGNALYTHGGPLNFLSHIFTMWRGSINLHLKFVKTGFHTGRIQVVWTPYNAGTLGAAPTIANSMFSLRHIIDIRDQDEYVVNLPYLVRDEYLRTAGTSLSETHMGVVTISVLNELRYPETVGSSIQLLEFYTAGDDFEFQAPGLVKVEPFTFQSNVKYMTSRVTRDLGPSVNCCSESITSLKQLADKADFASINGNLTLSSSGETVLVLDPWHSGYTYLASSTTLSRGAIDTMSFIGSLYAYQTGSVEIGAVALSGFSCNVSYIPYYLSEMIDAFGAATYNFVTRYTNVRSAVAATPAFATPTSMGLSTAWPCHKLLGATKCNSAILSSTVNTSSVTYMPVHAHYVSKFPVSFVAHTAGALNAATTVLNADTQPYPAGTIIINSTSLIPGATSNMTFFRSTGDDFRFKGFTGCPYLLNNSVAATN